MSDYSPVTSFVAKDSLSINDPLKKVVGAELDAEFDAIATAVATKQDSGDGGVANGLAELNANAKLKPAQMWANAVTMAIVASAVDFDTAISNQFYLVLTGNVTINAPTNPQNGQTIQILIRQDATGSRTVTWNAVFCFAGGSAPTQTVTAAKADLYTATYYSTLSKWVVTAAQNYTVA